MAQPYFNSQQHQAEPPPMMSSMPAVYRRGVSQSFRPASSFVDFFDFEFKKYLTPLIIKATFIFSFVIAGLLVTFHTIVFIGGVISPPTRSRGPFGALLLLSLVGAVDSDYFGSMRIPFLIVYYLASVLFTILAMLWLRVVFESLIVIFNIAAILTEIRDQGNDRRS